MTPSTALRTLLPTAMALCLFASPGALLHAKTQKPHNNQTTETPKKKGASKVTYQRSSSEESSAERDRRMYRECKGMHNAGACRGYTQK